MLLEAYVVKLMEHLMIWKEVSLVLERLLCQPHLELVSLLAEGMVISKCSR